ncbi:MAG: N-acetyl-gamma-glutamyl-phosphate reductase [Chthoniobacterales bacterium]|nr:N-acetyl-gamma-glutamyl-phosphate reductase [Chthoniobacterales bacterium]
MQKVKAAIVGASGYSGEELVALLARHPRVGVVAVTSRQSAGRTLAEVFPRMAGSDIAAMRFVEPSVEALKKSGATTVFLALPHGLAAEFAAPLRSAGIQVVDLSADFRLKSAEVFAEFYGGKHPAPELLAESVYALPEICGEKALKDAGLLACPGCYPTSILVPLVPLLRRKLLDASSIVINSLSGVSGAGRKAEVSYLFAECNESLRAYGVPKHRHLSEIEQELALAAGSAVTVSFTPHLVPVTRGMISTIVVPPDNGADAGAVEKAWAEDYAGRPFIRMVPHLPDSKHVAGTNFVDIAVRHDPRTGRLLLFSALDNLGKGAAGQAVQAFNMSQAWDERTGLL